VTDAAARLRLARLADRLQPALRSAHADALARLRAGVDLDALTTAIARGDVEGALHILFGSAEAVAALNGTGAAVRAAVADAARAWARSVLHEAADVAGTLPAVDLGVRAGGRLTPAVALRSDLPASTARALASAQQAARTAAAAAQAGTTEAWVTGARVAVADAVARTSAAGLNPRVAAREVQGTLGLGAHDAALVARVRADLASGDPGRLRAQLARALRDGRHDPALERAASGGAPLTEADVERQVASYTRGVEAWRAEAEARTLALDAARRGQDQQWRQTVAEGTVRGDTVTAEWITRLDGRERPQHHRMHHARVLLGTEFRDPATTRTWAYVGESDVQCRCAQLFVVHATPALAQHYVRDGSGLSAQGVPEEAPAPGAPGGVATATRRPAGATPFRPPLPG